MSPHCGRIARAQSALTRRPRSRRDSACVQPLPAKAVVARRSRRPRRCRRSFRRLHTTRWSSSRTSETGLAAHSTLSTWAASCSWCSSSRWSRSFGTALAAPACVCSDCCCSKGSWSRSRSPTFRCSRQRTPASCCTACCVQASCRCRTFPAPRTGRPRARSTRGAQTPPRLAPSCAASCMRVPAVCGRASATRWQGRRSCSTSSRRAALRAR
mmetsp:Transcript_20518/g.61149  ORF Transcript_20518/g.61149 Transcript_20518/m.61149 type:complete len:213 (+) Transcript_20518:454-1092(+)